MRAFSPAIVVVASFGLMSVPSAWAVQRYVVDEIAIVLRAEPDRHAKALTLVHSGEVVHQLELDPISGYARVRLPDRNMDGWLLARYLDDDPPLRQQLQRANKRLSDQRDRVAALESEAQRLRSALINALRALQNASEQGAGNARVVEDESVDNALPGPSAAASPLDDVSAPYDARWRHVAILGWLCSVGVLLAWWLTARHRRKRESLRAWEELS